MSKYHEDEVLRIMTEWPEADRLAGVLRVVRAMGEEIDASERGAALHADLNRRVAAALGKPQDGEGSTWHDLPECVTALRSRLALAEKVVDAARGRPSLFFVDLDDALMAYDAAKETQPERVGGVIARPSGPEDVATPASPGPLCTCGHPAGEHVAHFGRVYCMTTNDCECMEFREVVK